MGIMEERNMRNSQHTRLGLATSFQFLRQREFIGEGIAQTKSATVIPDIFDFTLIMQHTHKPRH